MPTTVEIRPGSVEARELALVGRALARGDAAPGTAQLLDDGGALVAVPAEIVAALRIIVEHLTAGHGVSVVPIHAELTTVDAAELLNVSRPHLIKLLDANALPFRMVGTHRRIRLVDVLAYREHQDVESQRALDELTRQAEELGLYD